MNSRFVLGCALAFATGATSVLADWPQYRGPTQNGVVPEKIPVLLKEPPPLWKINVGTGTASVTVAGTHAFTAGNFEKKTDAVVCLDTATGKTVWRCDYPQALDPNLFEGGPRATPTLDGDSVYVQGHAGDLFCLSAGSGKVKWHKNLVSDFGGKKPGWGYAGSPTVEGNWVIVEPGGSSASTVALDKATGALVWKSGSDESGYASPVVADFAKKRTIVVFKAKAIVGLDASNGQELWRSEWKTDYDINAATPLVVGNSLIVSSGYGSGIALFDVTPAGLVQKWRNRSLRAHINSPVIRKNSIFGIDGNVGGGNLVCLDLVSGNKKWEERSVKGGSLVLADDKLIILTEKGELVVAEAIASGFKALLRTHVMDKRCWVQPTLSGGKLFVKNNAGDLACLELK
jgi:outer membrane protein assembly factor BamB